MTNYGDELSRMIVERVLGAKVAWSPMARAEYVALGSIIDLYQAKGGRGRIWGSGIANPDREYATDEIAARTLSVRGPLTRDRLGLPSTTPLGDPGLLAADLWSFGARKAGLKVLVPHYSAFSSRAGRDAIATLQRDGYAVAHPNLTPDEMMGLIARAQFVASSGLHGVILAHAFGTPSALISLKPEQPAAPVFKYRDFFASIELEPRLVHWSSMLTDSQQGKDEADSADHRLAAGRVPVERLVESVRLTSELLA